MTNASTVLALKYRPQTFKDLIGQEVIAETIYNVENPEKSAYQVASSTTVDSTNASETNSENL